MENDLYPRGETALGGERLETLVIAGISGELAVKGQVNLAYYEQTSMGGAAEIVPSAVVQGPQRPNNPKPQPNSGQPR